MPRSAGSRATSAGDKREQKTKTSSELQLIWVNYLSIQF